MGQKIYQTFFPAKAEEERLKSLFPNLIYRFAIDSSYKRLNNQYREERYWIPEKYKLHDYESPERACKKGSFDEIKNEVTQEPMLEIFFHMVGLEANTWAMPVSKENAAIIRQMIKVNYCGYFADKNGTPTKAGNMVREELDNIEAKLKTSAGLKNQ